MGRGGDDVLDGGDNSARALYAGSRTEYAITVDAETGDYIVRDLREGSPEGTDRVRNVDTFVFSDGTILRLVRSERQSCPHRRRRQRQYADRKRPQRRY